MAKAKTTTSAQKKKTASIAEFHDSLILAKWALNFFGEGSFEKLKKVLGDSALEGLDPESGNTKFFHELTSGYLIPLNGIDEETLCTYDRNIVAHWTEITAHRNIAHGSTLKMKYFQWLSLLVTELYLDRFFNQKSQLREALNGEIAKFNADKPAKKRFSEIEETDLNKIAFWEATGAGKTLLLHVNIKQYLHYAGASRRPARIILLTPNEGLSRQHLEELRLSGFTAEMLSPENELLARGAQVGVIDAGKLISSRSDKKKGEKSMLAESFEGNNLVLVDEGHNGSSNENGERRTVREQLCRDGFSFEYSATFGQAVAKKADKVGLSLRESYAKAILFDYSYKFFHADGYGKDAMILNMSEKSLKALTDTSQETRTFEYLCACLLAFFQQRKIFKKYPERMAEYGIEKPLCVFVGNSVNAKNGNADNQDSTETDVRSLIKFLAKVVREHEKTKKIFSALLNGENVLTDSAGHNLITNLFLFLKNECGSGEAVYQEMLEDVFNAKTGARLVARHLSAAGEITLSIGSDAPAFALINIGDTAKFANALEKTAGTDFSVETDSLAGSVFHRINEKDSDISFLVGSRKFTEGWSSWRVSTMGLMNLGKSEGTQIIQLFGRGVRLRGRGFSLKRSTPDERRVRKIGILEKLETLNIFGIKAEYMAQFRQYLEEEGVRTLDDVLEIRFSPWKNLPTGIVLQKPFVKDGFRLNQKNGFKSQTRTLFEISDEDRTRINTPIATYSDFAALQKLSLKTDDKNAPAGTDDGDSTPLDVKIDARALPFFNWDKIYRELLNYKNERGYRNLRISRERLRTFCCSPANNDWYSLFARKENVTFDSFEKLPAIEKIFKALLFNYTDKFYKTFQRLFEDKHMTTVPFDESVIPQEYIFELPHDAENFDEWEKRLNKLKELVENRDVPALKGWNSKDLVAIVFDRHLYSPLIYKSDSQNKLPFTLRPLSFDAPSEKQFVEDLQKFYDENPKIFEGKDLFLMRNASNKSQGIGFAQAGNFYPDFLMWIVDKTTKRQYLTFVDPKGLLHMRKNNPKLNFCEEIKSIQKNICEETGSNIVLNSVILSATKEIELNGILGTKNELETQNVFFLADGGDVYLPKLFRAALRD